MIVKAISYAVMLIFAQNLLFSGGYGTAETIRVVSSKKKRLFCAALTAYSLAVTILSYGLIRLIGYITDNIYIVYMCVILSAGIVYVVSLIALKMAGMWKRVSGMSAAAALSSVVLIVPFAAQSLNTGFIGAVFMSVGGSIGYALALFIVSEGAKRLGGPSVPKAFRGLPAMLLFIGILAMVFSSFSGFPFNV